MQTPTQQNPRRPRKAKPATGLGTRMAERFKDECLPEAVPELRGGRIEPVSLEAASAFPPNVRSL